MRNRLPSGRVTLEANPGLLELPCDIGGTKTVQEFVRHIWAWNWFGANACGQPVIEPERDS